MLGVEKLVHTNTVCAYAYALFVNVKKKRKYMIFYIQLKHEHK